MYRIAVIPGDGTGPEVVREGLKVLEAVASKTGFKYETTTYDFGGDRYLRDRRDARRDERDRRTAPVRRHLPRRGRPSRTSPRASWRRACCCGCASSSTSTSTCARCSSTPACGRPLKDKRPEDIDFVVVRENTEGLYTGMGGVQYKGTPQEVSTQINCTTRFGAERAIRYAFDVSPPAQQEEARSRWSTRPTC